MEQKGKEFVRAQSVCEQKSSQEGSIKLYWGNLDFVPKENREPQEVLSGKVK